MLRRFFESFSTSLRLGFGIAELRGEDGHCTLSVSVMGTRTFVSVWMHWPYGGWHEVPWTSVIDYGSEAGFSTIATLAIPAESLRGPSNDLGLLCDYLKGLDHKRRESKGS